MERCDAIDSILDLLTSSPQMTVAELSEWIFIRGDGDAVLEQRDDFGVSVRSILFDWGLSRDFVRGACEAASTRMDQPVLQENGVMPSAASDIDILITEGQTTGEKNTTPGSAASDTDKFITEGETMGEQNTVMSGSTASDVDESATDGQTSGEHNITPIVNAKNAEFKPENTTTTTTTTAAAVLVDSGRRIAFPTKVASTLSNALLQRLDEHPCAHCFFPEFMESLSVAPRELSALGNSGGGGVGGESAVTIVTSVTGMVGWWVQQIELRRLTTNWAAKKTLPPRSQYAAAAVVKGLVQEQRSSWYACEAHTGASEHERAAVRVFEPVFDLEPCEAVVRVEQLVTPRSHAERRDQQPRRAVVQGRDAETEEGDNGGGGGDGGGDGGSGGGGDDVGISVLALPGWPGPVTGEVVDAWQEFDFTFTTTCEVDHFDGATYAQVPCFKLAGGKDQGPKDGWVVDFDPAEPARRRVREIVSPVTTPPIKFSLVDEVRVGLNRPTFDLGASLHFTTSFGRCYSLVGRGNKESCFVVCLAADSTWCGAGSSGGAGSGGGRRRLIGLEFAGSECVVRAVDPNSGAAQAGVRPRSRITAVLPGGSGGPGHRITAAPRSRPRPPSLSGGGGCAAAADVDGASAGAAIGSGSGDASTAVESSTLGSAGSAEDDDEDGGDSKQTKKLLPSTLFVDTTDELFTALESCVEHGWTTAALCFTEYPFTTKEFDLKKRLLFEAPAGHAVVGLAFEQGQLTGTNTEISPPPRPHLCSTCGGSKARALADWYRSLAQRSRSGSSRGEDRRHRQHRQKKDGGSINGESKWEVAQAARWYRLATEEGDEQAKRELASMHDESGRREKKSGH